MSQEAAVDSLLLRVAQGDADAVGACIQRYSALVWSLARGLTRDVSMLEDVVQDIFIDVWKSAHRYDPEKSSETTFISTIARRRVIDKRRRMNRRTEEEVIEEETVADVDRSLEHLETCDEAQKAIEAVDQLKPDQRKVLLLSIVEGLTHTEIAEQTGIPLGTVKSHVRRGLDKVATILKTQPPTERRASEAGGKV